MSGAIGLAGFLAACFVVATTGAVFKPGDWYDGLRKPSWQPPKFLFPIAWTILYIMIAVSGWLVWRRAGFAGAPGAFVLFALQLVLNAAWSPLFFGLKRMDLAFGVALAMAIAVAATIAAFAPIDATAAWLLAPYLAWVCFAAVLNRVVWRLNPEQIGVASGAGNYL